MIHVVAAAVTDAAGRVLIAQRPTGKVLAGGWEFPGGKVDPGESRVEALRRELREELGITLTEHPRPLMRLRHAYPHGEVLIDMWVVTHYEGRPIGLDGQALRWCTQEELAGAELLPADRPLVRALILPARLESTHTPDYIVSAQSPVALGTVEQRLLGRYCVNMADARSAEQRGTDFVVIGFALADRDATALCTDLKSPIFLQSSDALGAFRLGASGTHALSIENAHPFTLKAVD